MASNITAEVETTITSGGTSSSEHGGNSLGKDLNVQPERPFIDILEIKLHPLLEWNGVSAVNLP